MSGWSIVGGAHLVGNDTTPTQRQKGTNWPMCQERLGGQSWGSGRTARSRLPSVLFSSGSFHSQKAVPRSGTDAAQAPGSPPTSLSRLPCTSPAAENPFLNQLESHWPGSSLSPLVGWGGLRHREARQTGGGGWGCAAGGGR